MKKIVAAVVLAAVAFAGCEWCRFGEDAEPVKAALYVGKGAHGVGEYGWLQIVTFAEGMDTTLVDAEAIRNGALDKADMLIMPGGSSWDISEALGKDGRKKVEKFIRRGGGYVGTCAGAFLASESSKSHPDMANFVPFTSRGGCSRADMMIRFNSRAEALAGIKAGTHRISYAGGPVFEFAKPVRDAEYEVVATYDSNINTWTDKEVPTMAGKAAVIAGRCGKGKVFVSAVHPEVDIDDHYVIEGAFRFVTGRKITWRIPQRRLGDLAVGVHMDKGLATVADAERLRQMLANARRDGLDLIPVNRHNLPEGMSRHVDVVVQPTPAGFEKIAETRKLPPTAFGHIVDKPRDGKKVKVAIYSDKGGTNFSVSDRLALSPEFEVKALGAKDIASGGLKGYDMLLQPGGWSPAQYNALGTNGCAAIDRFIRDGGSYYGICAGAFLASQTANPKKPRASFVPWKDIGEPVYRGWCPIKVKFTEEGMAALGTTITNRFVMYWGGPVFEPGTPIAGADVRAWGHYFGHNLNTCTADDVKPMGGKAAFLGGTLGKGKVFISAPHPEKDDRTYDIVYGAIKYLTGVRPDPVPNNRCRGALSVAITDMRTPEYLNMFLDSLIRDRRFDVRVKWSKSDLKHLDAIVFGSPDSDSFSRSVEEFAENGGKVLALVDTPAKAKAVGDRDWVIRVARAADIPATLGKIAKDPCADAERKASAVSPDGKNEIRLYANPLAYEVLRNGEVVVGKTPIDLEVAGKGLAADFCGPMAVTNLSRTGMVRTPVYKKAAVDLAANEAFADCGAWGVRLVARDDGVAYRFETKMPGEIAVTHERAGVSIDADALCHVPFTTAYGREQRHPETLKAADLHVFDPVRPKFAYLPFLCRTKGVTVAVAESDVIDYPVLNLARTSPANTAGAVGMESVFARWPSKTVNNAGVERTAETKRQRHWHVRGRENLLVRTDGTRTFPWRCFMLAEDYAKIGESDIVYALARPAAAKADFGWVKPGKVAWEWWNAFDNIGDPARKGHKNGCTTATYRRFIDFAAKNGIEYVIMDEGWSKKLDIWEFSPDVDVPGLIKYGEQRGVGIILWMAWAQVEGQEAKVAEHFAKLGAKGFKVDFMDRGDAQVERFLWKFADECAKRKLVVDYHGAHRPTGMSRAYPNVLNYEGIHGLEVMKFYDGKEDFMDNDVKSAFVRMAAGPLDYTPGAMRNFPRKLPKGEKGPADYRVPGSFGTRCHQIALMSMFEAPLQMLCDSPTHYEQNQECFDFMAKTPVVWARTAGLGGTPDTYAAFARQSHGGDWWVSAISNWEPRDITIDTAFLGEGAWQAEIFRDADDCDREPTHYVREFRRVTAGDEIGVRLAPGGGCAIRFARPPVRVAVYTDKGARSTGVYRHVQLNELAEEIEETPVDAEMIRKGALDNADLLVMPGGSSVTIAKNLGEKGREAIRDFIRNGGSYFGTCAGACLMMESASHHPNMLNVIPYRTIGARGHADMMIRFNEDAKRLAGIPVGRQRVRYAEGPVLVPSKPVEGASFVPIAFYDSHIDTDSTKRRETMCGKIAGVAGTYGKGKVLVYSVHPEYDYDDHNLISGAYRFLTGRDLAWKIPQRKRGQLAVGLLTENSWSVEAANLARTLARGEEFDVEPINRSEMHTGVLRHLDVLVAPTGNEFAAVKGRYFKKDCKPLIEDFQKRGGTIVAWGEAAAEFRKFGGEVIEVKDASGVADALRQVAARERKPAQPVALPAYGGKKIRTAVYTDKGGANYSVLETFAMSPEYEVTVVSAKDVATGILTNFDLLLQPGGGCNTQYQALGTNGANQIERFVRNGGKYYGICAGAFLATQSVPKKPRIGLVPFRDQNIGVYRGWGTVPLKMTEEGLKVFGNSVTNRDVVYWGGPAVVPGDPVPDSDVKVLATYDCDDFCTCATNAIPSWRGTGALLGGRVGKGKVFISGPHPEKEESSYDIVYSALEYLTGVRPTQVRRDRRPGARRVLFKTDKKPEVAALYAKKVLFDPALDVRASADLEDLSHYDMVFIPSPHAKDFGRKLQDFARNGGEIVVLTDTPEKAAAVKDVAYVRKVATYDEVSR